MRHLRGNKKIGRPSDQRIALLKTQAKSLILHGELLTSHAKAIELASYMQKIVTWARKGDVSSLRNIRREISDRNLILKLTTEIVPKLKSDSGGEVSVIRAGQRRGDGAQLAVIVFNVSE